MGIMRISHCSLAPGHPAASEVKREGAGHWHGEPWVHPSPRPRSVRQIYQHTSPPPPPPPPKAAHLGSKLRALVGWPGAGHARAELEMEGCGSKGGMLGAGHARGRLCFRRCRRSSAAACAAQDCQHLPTPTPIPLPIPPFLGAKCHHNGEPLVWTTLTYTRSVSAFPAAASQLSTTTRLPSCKHNSARYHGELRLVLGSAWMASINAHTASASCMLLWDCHH